MRKFWDGRKLVTMHYNERKKTIKILTKYFLSNQIYRIDLWIVSSTSLLILSIFAINTLRTVQKDVFIISNSIYSIGIFLIACFQGLFISSMAIIKIARDFDSRVYETYLYGPVDNFCYLLSIVITFTLINVLISVFFPIIWLVILFFLTGIPLIASDVVQLVMGSLVVETMLMLGLVFSTRETKESSALWINVIVQVFLIGVIFAHTVISKYLIPIKRTDIDLFKFFRDLFGFLFSFSRFISPHTNLYLLGVEGQFDGILVFMTVLFLFVANIGLFIMAQRNASRRLV